MGLWDKIRDKILPNSKKDETTMEDLRKGGMLDGPNVGGGGAATTAAPQTTQVFPFGDTNYAGGFVQPHINPRFANAFGINIGLGQGTTPAGQHNNMSYAEPAS